MSSGVRPAADQGPWLSCEDGAIFCLMEVGWGDPELASTPGSSGWLRGPGVGGPCSRRLDLTPPCRHVEAGALVMEVDHDRQLVHMETLGLTLHEPEALLAAMRPSEEHVASRLTSPIVSTHLDTRNVAFERSVGAWPCHGQGSGSGLWEAGPPAEAVWLGLGAVTAGPVTLDHLPVSDL